MHEVAPRVVLGDKWWRVAKEAAYRSTAYHCLACGVYKHQAEFHHWLEAHEVYTVDYLLGRMYYQETVPLCHACHNYIHSGRLQALLDKKEISRSRYNTIVRHGERVLRGAGLKVKSMADEATWSADWEDWRLVVDGVEYPPKFKTFEEWKEQFNG